MNRIRVIRAFHKITGSPFCAEGELPMFTMPIDHFVDLQVQYVDAGGNPASIDGAVTWLSSNDAVVVLEPDRDDSTKCRATSAQTVGQVQVTATADADLGDGVRNLVTLMDMNVVAGEAVAGTISPAGESSPVEGTDGPR